MIKKFFRDNSVHKNIVKYFDFLFLFNIPYFFVLLMLFVWGMSASNYSRGIEQINYFLLNFSVLDSLFFVFLFLFLSFVNVKIQIDDLLILDWDNKDDQYKLNLNYLYVCPNFISIKKVNSFLNIPIILLTLVPIAYISPYLWPILVLYYILINRFNHKLLKTESYLIFIKRCILKLFCFYLIFLSGWVYVSTFDISMLQYFPLFCLAVLPVIFMNELIFVDKFSEKESKNRIIIQNDKNRITFLSLIMMLSLFFISFSINDSILSHFSIISVPFFIYAFIRSEFKDFVRCYSYPIMIMNILVSWTLYPILLFVQIIIYYLSKYYYWHRFNIHFPKFVIEENE